MFDDVLILGATGRTGRWIAQRLDQAGVSLALYGRSRQRLAEAAAELTQDPRLVTGSLDDLREELAANPPAVVISTVGPFASSAATVIDSLPAGTHYVDLSNEYASFEVVFARNEQAIRGAQTLIAGAGFGVVSTESVLLTLCEDRPTPTHVRVDALPSLAVKAGVIGEALAGKHHRQPAVRPPPSARRQPDLGCL